MAVRVFNTEDTFTGDNDFFRISNGRNFNSGDRIIPLIKDNTDPARPYIARNRSVVNGTQNLITDAAWANKSSLNVNDVLPLIISEYQPSFSNTIGNLLQTFTTINSLLIDIDLSDNGVLGELNELRQLRVRNPIKNSIIAERTGFRYVLPMLSLPELNNSTQLGAGENSNGNFLTNATSALRQRFINNSSAGFGGSDPFGLLTKALVGGSAVGGIIGDTFKALYPKLSPLEGMDSYYNSSASESRTITLDLLNTISTEQTKYHKELVELWSHQFSAEIRSQWVADSPVLASVEYTGLRWVPAAHINFKVESHGIPIEIDGEIYPECYTCSFEIQDLIAPYRVIMDAYLQKGEKFQAFTRDKGALCAELERGIESISQISGNLFG